RRTRHQYRPIRHQIPVAAPARLRGLFTRRSDYLAIPVGRLLPERLRNHTKAGKFSADRRGPRPWPLKPTLFPPMRRIAISSLKILVSAGLLYLALRKVDFHELASRFNVASVGWIGLAIAATFLQIFIG